LDHDSIQCGRLNTPHLSPAQCDHTTARKGDYDRNAVSRNDDLVVG
jgi:hypothetical protein